MNADPVSELREAARLMRERAGAVPPSPWFAGSIQVNTADPLNVISQSGLPERARYIASWHPDVALAVADWLDAEAKSADLLADGVMVPREPIGRALAVARIYLGRADA